MLYLLRPSCAVIARLRAGGAYDDSRINAGCIGETDPEADTAAFNGIGRRLRDRWRFNVKRRKAAFLI
jgi:hypothetical protein